MTPGDGYLEALSAENVTVRNDKIHKITPEGIEMWDGTRFPVDAIICATGFDTSYRPPFSVIGNSGRDLRDEWAVEPRSYLSVAANGFPNYFSKQEIPPCAAYSVWIWCFELRRHEH
jgi:cation diffusion facilitator CzcD-associated flavoprotein CzcO